MRLRSAVQYSTAQRSAGRSHQAVDRPAILDPRICIFLLHPQNRLHMKHGWALAGAARRNGDGAWVTASQQATPLVPVQSAADMSSPSTPASTTQKAQRSPALHHALWPKQNGNQPVRRARLLAQQMCRVDCRLSAPRRSSVRTRAPHTSSVVSPLRAGGSRCSEPSTQRTHTDSPTSVRLCDAIRFKYS